MSLYVGLRFGELTNLVWSDVDLAQGFVLIRDPKNQESRYAYLNETAKAVLESRPRGNPGDLIFPATNGKQRAWVSQVFAKVVADLGLNDHVTDRRQKVVWHTLRHTCGSWLVQNGASLYEVGAVLGHKSLVMAKRYSHLGNDHIRGAVARLDGLADQDRDGQVVNLGRDSH